ncbi:MAG: type II toxin-antitoxin system VapC family toxin [Candidatus Sumerlaeota bacterium]|nr:type II toxin-antitoxin system VapC family toxin [Candidatus Sumerlaeota bacterium]
MRIYIESTIPSYIVARPARDLLQAARQQITRDWWDLRRERHELFASQVVLDEIAAGEPDVARRRLDLMAGVNVLDLTPAAEALAERILQSGLLPASADGDAAHIAIATVHRMDVLLTWNCRHIANAAIVGRLRRLVDAEGFSLPEIYTPEELSGEQYE